jgi:hypothetical protein
MKQAYIQETGLYTGNIDPVEIHQHLEKRKDV